MSLLHEVEAEDPLLLFDAWMADATSSEINDPNAAALATASADGSPTVRMVLVKQSDGRRFCFFTNVESRKGAQLMENPRAALCFHWKSLRRQVRLEGRVGELSADEADRYFHSRARRSQIGAAVSEQSRVLESREALEERVRRFEETHPGQIVRPQYWRGFCLEAERIEFWMDGENRLHDRFLFTRNGDSWTKCRLFP